MINAINEDIRVNDPDYDKIPHLIMQLRKSIDAAGGREIVFQDGVRLMVQLSAINNFLEIYDHLKPIDREDMQKYAARSFDDFINASVMFANKEVMPKSIYQ